MKIKLLCILLILSLSGLWALELPVANIPQISVSITGFVPQPGHYKMNPTDRISNLLELAMLDQAQIQQHFVPAEEEEEQYTKLNPIPMLRENDLLIPDYDKMISLRTVELQRGGNSTYYDLLKFYRLGDLEQNPILRDGDLLYVTIIKDFISVSGCVGKPGELEYYPGDTLQSVLSLAHRTLPGADLSAVRISRYMGSGNKYQFETVDYTHNPQLQLNPGDRIMVPYDAGYRARKAVTVSGEIKHHGEYIVDDNSTLWDLIQLAGGVTEKADLSNAVVLNRSYNENPDPEFERMKMRSMAELTPFEYSYMRVFMRQAKGVYSIDFQKLIASEGKEENRILNNLDYIYIPEKMNAVWVSGNIRNPGLVEFREGENWKYYVKQAGGYANSSLFPNTRILRVNSGNWVKAKSKQEVRPGDMVFVPEKIDRHFWTDVKDIVTVTASAITILIGVQNLSK